MSNAFKEGALGGIRFSAPVFSFGSTTPAVNSGFNFDLPIASIQSMGNNALSFTQNNANASRGFLSNVIGTSNAGVNATAQQSIAYQNNALKTVREMTPWHSAAFFNIADALEAVVTPQTFIRRF